MGQQHGNNLRMAAAGCHMQAGLSLQTTASSRCNSVLVQGQKVRMRNRIEEEQTEPSDLLVVVCQFASLHPSAVTRADRTRWLQRLREIYEHKRAALLCP